MADLLLPREAAKFVSNNSSFVSISTDGVSSLANLIIDCLHSNREQLNADRWKLNELNNVSKNEATVEWVFVTDILNFCFYSDDQEKKFTVKQNGKRWTGYWAWVAAVNRAIQEGIPITDAGFYAKITEKDLHRILRSDSPYEMPMLDERLQVLREAGEILVKDFGGKFANFVSEAKGSARKLLELLTSAFPSLRDVATYKGCKVALYKRAQIIIADLWASFSGQEFGSFHDIDDITMFADYRIPQCLVWFGALKYSEELMESLQRTEELRNGEEREVEIRANSIWAVELVVQKVKELIAADDRLPNETLINAIIVDHYLWDYRREREEETAKIPFHRTRCIYY